MKLLFNKGENETCVQCI